MSPLLRALPVFSAAYAVLYVIAMYFNIAMFVYYPQPAQWHWHDTPGLPGPAMYWYGWIANAAVGAAIIAAIITLLPAASLRRLSATAAWLAPLCAMATVLFIIRSWFIR
jgi:hypothetical protein